MLNGGVGGSVAIYAINNHKIWPLSKIIRLFTNYANIKLKIKFKLIKLKLKSKN